MIAIINPILVLQYKNVRFLLNNVLTYSEDKMTHNVSNDELVTGLIGYDEIDELDIVYKRVQGGTFSYIHNYIGDDDSPLGVRQVVRIRTKGGFSGSLSHSLRTEKGMEPIFMDKDGKTSYWTLPRVDFLYSEAREGRDEGGV